MTDGGIGRGLRRWGQRLIRNFGAPVGLAADGDWQSRFRRAMQTQGAEAFLLAHPRIGALPPAFSIGGYLARNADVANAAQSPAAALYHYLEHGMAEARAAQSETWCADFVRAYHGLDLPCELTPTQVLARIRATGVAPQDTLLRGADLWLSLGTYGPVLDNLFDHDVYAVLADAAGHPPPAPDRLSCIRHAVQVGLRAGVPLHPDHRVDPAFYRDGLRMRGYEGPEGDAASHWARVGLRVGAHANPRSHIRVETGLCAPEAITADLAAFRDAAPGLARGATDAETVQHLLAVPAPGVAAYALDRPEVRGFLRGLARYRQARDDVHGAMRLLEVLHRADRTDPDVAGDLAPLIRRDGRPAAERALRRTALAGSADPANRIALATGLRDQGDLAGALDVLAPVAKHPPTQVSLRRRFDRLACDIFDDLWDTLPTQIAAHGVPAVQALLTKALGIATPPVPPPASDARRPRPVRTVALLANADLPQCKLYRADQKAEQLRAAGLSVSVFDHGADLDALAARLDRFDALICLRVPGFPRVAALIAQATALGLGTFYDIDDLVFDMSEFPPPLSSYAGTITAHQRDVMACGVPLFAHAMSLCDTGIASTPALQDAMARYVRSGRVILHRNGIGWAHRRVMSLAPPAGRDGDKVVLFYGSGTKAHKAAFHDCLEPALARVLAARPGRVLVHLVGEFGQFVHLDPDHPDVDVVSPIADFEAYAAMLVQADISLAVLDRSAAADAKSEIKWIEAAMLAIPSVVSATNGFRDAIADGETGILCTDTAAFEKALLRLTDDAGLRSRIGNAAQARVMRDYAPERLGHDLARALGALSTPATPPVRRKTRILIVNVFFPPRDIGGATHVVRDNVRDLLARHGDRFEVDVIATRDDPRDPYGVACDAWGGARVWTIATPPGGDVMMMQDPRVGDVFDRLLDRIAPDLVHFHCIQHLTLAVVDATRRRGIPYVVTLHDGWWVSSRQFIASDYGGAALYDYHTGPGGRLPDRARVLFPRLADAAAVLAVSEPFAVLHRKAGLPFVSALENGITAHGAVPAVRVPAVPGRVRIGHVGGMSRHKGFNLLRAAIEKAPLSSIELSVIDHALPTGATRTEIWNGTPVTVQSRVAPDAMGAHYASLDVLVAPSIWPESYGLVTREAVAAGLWVVASDQGAIADVIEDGINGHIVSVDGPASLSECLAAIDKAPDRYATRPPRVRDLRPSMAQADALRDLYSKLTTPQAEDHGGAGVSGEN